MNVLKQNHPVDEKLPLNQMFLYGLQHVLAMYAGADYIKTSTGKLEPAATPEAAYVMCQAIKEYYKKRSDGHERTLNEVNDIPSGLNFKEVNDYLDNPKDE